MAGRRSVWSDPRLVEAARAFVPAADEVWRLQRRDDPECLFFQRAVNGGEPITDGGTRQGIWVISPGGTLLAAINSNHPDKVLAVLERGLAAWEELPPEQRVLDPAAELDAVYRWEHDEPVDGLVLDRVARELDAEGEPTGRWNRDFAWFSRGEVQAWLPAEPKVGDVTAVPAAAQRLARFHLVDNARGQTLPFAPGELERASLETEVLAVEGERVRLALRGATRADAAGPWLLGDNLWKPKPHQEHPHGIETTLLGRAVFDRAAGSFVEFDLVALGRRWGRTAFNGRGRDASPGPIAFHFRLAAAPGTGSRVAPTFVAVYDGDWIRGHGDG